MLAYLRLEILRVVRNQRYVLLSLVSPIGFYLLFSSIFGRYQAEGLRQPVELMVAMAAYGAVGAALFTAGQRVADERAIGWLRQLRATPMAARKVLGAKVLAAMVVGLPSVVLVGATAAIAHGVRMAAWQWAAFVILTTLGTAPFALLGLFIGYSADADSAYSMTLGAWFVFTAIGGLWMPLAILPRTLRTIGRTLPTNRLADLGWRIAGGHAPSATSGLILVAWTGAVALLAAWSYRRANVRS